MNTDILPNQRCLVCVKTDARRTLAIWTPGDLVSLPEWTLDSLLAAPLGEIRRVVEAVSGEAIDPSDTELLAPVDGQEVWGAGVTYERSREARMEETQARDIYSQVYEAARPELFFKAAGWRVVPSGGRIGIRMDSSWDVPEPELAAVSNAFGDLVGYSCGNDMSSRSIEGENPLYLPQSKIYDNSCAIGPALVPAWEIEAADLTIAMTISRAGETLFEGEASTSQLMRRPDELIAVLHSSYTLPVGAWLLTGTCLVPSAPYTAEAGDHVTISIAGLGTLTVTVAPVKFSGASAPPRAAAAAKRSI